MSSRPPIDRRRLAIRLAPCIVLMVAANVGYYTGFAFAKNHPALLLMVDSRNRHLALAGAAGLSPVWFFGIGFVRLVLPDPFFYLLGRDYGDEGLTWLERQTNCRTGYLGWVKRWFRRAADVLLVVMPNTFVCLLAGIDRVPPRRVAVLDVIGTAGRLVLFWWLAHVFQAQLTSALDFIERFQWPLVAGAAALAVLQGYRRPKTTLGAPPPSTDQH